MAKIKGGYIILSRKTIDSEIWSKPPLYLKVWVWLLSHAQFKGYKGLKRGQIRTKIPDIVKGISWKSGYRKEYPSKDQVYKVIAWLKKNNDITTKRATHGMIITIENYNIYQDAKNYGSKSQDNIKTAKTDVLKDK